MAKASTKGLIVAALVLSLATSFMIYWYLNGVAKKANKPGLPVVVAKVDIPPRTVVTADMVQVINVPAEYIQPEAMTELKKVVGVNTREQIIAGEQITQRRLVIEGKAKGFTGLIPPDKRAVTLAVNEVTGVAGFVKPGDYVDVVVTFDKGDVGSHTSKLVLQNILVLAVGHDTEAGLMEGKAKDGRDSAKSSSTVTLAVNCDDAARIALAEEKGKFRLALRPYMPNGGTVVTTASTPQDQVGAQNLPVHNESGGGAAASSSPANNPPPLPPAGVMTGGAIQTIRGTKVEIVPVS